MIQAPERKTDWRSMAQLIVDVITACLEPVFRYPSRKTPGHRAAANLAVSHTSNPNRQTRDPSFFTEKPPETLIDIKSGGHKETP
jgi:hypothetical protein